MSKFAQVALEKTTVPYRTVGKHPILADVYRPQGKELRPVIVWLHGGALITGNREAIDPHVRSLAEEQKYALVSFDYRLAPETKSPAIISDVEAAFKWLGNDGDRRFHLDYKRIVVASNSAGGYFTLVAGYTISPKPNALVALYDYGQLNVDWYTKPNPFPEYNAKFLAQADAEAQSDGAPAKRKGDGETTYMHYRQTGSWVDHVTGFTLSGLDTAIADYAHSRHR